MYGDLLGFNDYATFEAYDVTNFTDQQITSRLKRAAVRLDAALRCRFIGARIQGNELEWPRNSAVGTNTGAEYPIDAIPQVVINAAYELAYRELIGEVGAIAEEKGAVVAEAKSLISGMNKSVNYAEKKYSKSVEAQSFEYVEMMLSDVLAPKSGGMFRIVRGCQ